MSCHDDRSHCKPSIRGELIGNNLSRAAGFSSTGPTPVLALCRTLLAAGFDPAQSLEIYRGNNTLALRVGSIGEAAKLAVEDSKIGKPILRRWRDRPARDGAAPPIERITPEGADIGARR